MNILITGGAGFIGSSIARALLDKGFTVTIIDDFYSGRKRNIPAGSSFYEMDLRDKKLLQLFKDHEINYVYHQAARGDVRGSLINPYEYCNVNIEGGINLLECSRINKIKGVSFASSGGCVYGEPEFTPTTEDHKMSPIDPYGATKACFEIYLETYRRLYDLNYTIFRYPNVYGPYQNPFGEAGVISIFTKLILDDKEVVINGDGENIRDYVYIDDIVSANLLALNNNSNSPLNVGTGKGTTVNQIYQMLLEIIGATPNKKHGPKKEGEIQKSLLDSHKIQSLWGWKPEVDLRTGLTNTVNFIKEFE